MTQHDFAWYVIHAYSGFESKVVEAIKERAAKKNCAHLFETLLVPSEGVVHVKRGVKVHTRQSVFPGYILARMMLTEDTWHLVKSIPRVSGFLGTRDKPIPVSEKEVERILKQVQEGSITTRVASHYQIGDQVKVCEGPFNTFSGTVEEVDDTKQRLRVAVSIFGRPTPVDLDFSQVEKI